MILKGSQRGSGQNLAVHLLRTNENEHVSVHQVRGFASSDLKEAFKEVEAISRGTRCKQYLFSLSLNPPEQERVPVDVFERAIDRIEERLGLEGQARVIVFHEKEGRRHAHCAWSRIDVETMTAKQMSFFKRRLMGISRELYLENGWKMPRGLTNYRERDPTNFSLAEWQQAKREGIDPRWLKTTLQDCWKHSDNRAAFEHSLGEHGFFLARGDTGRFVILDHAGKIHSLPRVLGIQAKQVRERLGDGEDLKSVEKTLGAIGEKMSPAIKRHIEESRSRFRERSNVLAGYKEEMTKLHRDARVKLDQRQSSEWDEATLQRAARLPKGLRGLWHRLTGKYQEARRLNEAEALAQRDGQKEERQALIDTQREQRAVLQAQFKELRHRQAELLLDLRRDVGRYLSLSRGSEGRDLGRGLSVGLKLER